MQTIFNIAIMVYLLSSTTHLIWQFKQISNEDKEIRMQILIAMILNIILLLFNIFVFF